MMPGIRLAFLLAAGALSAVAQTPPLVLVTPSVPAARMGTRYEFTFSAQGGLVPYTWEITGGARPPGLILDGASGQLRGVPEGTGAFTFTVRVRDSRAAFAERMYTLTVAAPEPPQFALMGLPVTLSPATQLELNATVQNSSALAFNVRVVLTFMPAVAGIPDDPGFVFADGTRTFTFIAPPASMVQARILMQVGTVAGTARLTVLTSTGGVSVPSGGTSDLVFTTTVPSLPPVIAQASIRQLSATALEIEVIGFSTGRELNAAQFRFQARPGAVLQTFEFRIDLQPLAAAYYGSVNSFPFGSSFRYTQPFQIEGDATAFSAVDVTLTNPAGVSNSVTVRP
jgi:hypothetical protein